MSDKNCVESCGDLVKCIVQLAKTLELECMEQYPAGKRIWGSSRKIDVIIADPTNRRVLGIECKFQKTPGTTEEKIPAVIEDIKSWSIYGIIVYGGEGITQNMKSFLVSTGRALEIEELESWLRLYFGILKR